MAGDVLLPRLFIVSCTWTQYYTGRACVCAFYLFKEHSRFPVTRVRPHAIRLRRHVKCNGLTISFSGKFFEVSRSRYLTPAEPYTPN